MSNKHLKEFCLKCLLFIIVGLQSLAIAYLIEVFNFNTIEKALNKCGENYFFSTIMIDESSYEFGSVDGCSKAGKGFATCVYSVKDSNINSYYNNSHALDSNTKKYLNSLPENQIIFIDNFSVFKDKKAINDLLSNTIKEIKLVWFVAIKDKENKTARKVLTVTSVKPKSFCNKQIASLLRQEVVKQWMPQRY